MVKRLDKTTKLAILVSAFALVYTVADYRAARGMIDDYQSQCQYPTRPLVDGHCDNSDPAVPEDIKSEVQISDNKITEVQAQAPEPRTNGGCYEGN